LGGPAATTRPARLRGTDRRLTKRLEADTDGAPAADTAGDETRGRQRRRQAAKAASGRQRQAEAASGRQRQAEAASGRRRRRQAKAAGGGSGPQPGKGDNRPAAKASRRPAREAA